MLKTSDHILVGKVPSTSHVYPGRRTFSAAGVMKWPEGDPFQAIKTKCKNRIKHSIDLKSTKLLSFGVDARKLYFQFSFLEDVKRSSDVIIDDRDSASLTLK